MAHCPFLGLKPCPPRFRDTWPKEYYCIPTCKSLSYEEVERICDCVVPFLSAKDADFGYEHEYESCDMYQLRRGDLGVYYHPQEFDR